MKSIIKFCLPFLVMLVILPACEVCYDCTLETPNGPITKENECGKRKDIEPDIKDLESTGWRCEKQ